MKAFRISLLLFALLQFSGVVRASHAMGADITYQCLNANGDYKVTLTYYRNCSGVPVCSGSCSNIGACTKTMQVRGADSGYNGTVFFTFNVMAKTVRDVAANVNPKCPNGKSICDNMGCVTAGNLTPGIERYDFEGIVNLGASNANIPGAACKLLLSFEECCRDTSIQNIVGGNNFYSEAMLNRCLSIFPNCNSPALTNDPVFTMCAGQGFIYNQGVFDPDMDSLQYSFAPALEGYGDTATYIPPYSYDVPFPYKFGPGGLYPYGIKIDPITGDLMFTPNAFPFSGVCVIMVKQWRMINGVPQLVGTIQRDVLMNIQSCTANNPPAFATIPPGVPPSRPKTKFTISSGSNFCFTVIAKDTDVLDTTYLSWNGVMSKFGATFVPSYDTSTRTTNGPREDSYTFCWKPHDSLASAQPYAFTIKALDTKCLYAGIVTQMFSIKVMPAITDPGITTSVKCATATLSHTTPPSMYSSVQWMVSLTPNVFDSTHLYTTQQQTFNLAFQQPGKYPLRLYAIDFASGKGKTYYDTITITRVLRIQNNDTSICSGSATHDIVLRQLWPDPSFNYRWYRWPDMITVLGTADTLLIKTDSSTLMLVQSYDSAMACYFRDSFNLKVVHPDAGITLASSDAQCFNTHKFVFRNSSFVGGASYPVSYLWTFSDGDTTSRNDFVTKTFTSVGAKWVRLVMSTAFGCKDTAFRNLFLFSNPVTPEITGDSVAPQGSTRSYSVQGHNTSSYTWAVVGDTASPLTMHVLPTLHFSVVIPWGNVDWGGLAVIETDSNACQSDTATLAVRLTSGTGISALHGTDQIIIYPQPASDKLILSGNTDGLETAELKNIDGRLLHAFTKEELLHRELPVNAVETGVYLLYFTDGNGQGYVQKVSIVK